MRYVVSKAIAKLLIGALSVTILVRTDALAHCSSLFPISTKNEIGVLRWGYIDCDGVVIVPPKFTRTLPFVNAGVVQDGEVARIVDSRGSILFQIEGEVLTPFNNEAAIARMKSGFNIVGLSGAIIGKLPPEFVFHEAPFFSFGTFADGLAPIQLDGEVAFIDRFGKIRLRNNFEATNGFYDNLARVVLSDGKVAIINNLGRIVFGPSLRDVSDPSEESFVVQVSKRRWNVLSRNGVAVLALNYDYVGRFHEGRAEVNDQNKWGFIDKKGELVIPMKFDDVEGFSDGLAGVMIRNKWGFINRSGTLVIPDRYDLISSFTGSLSFVRTKTEEGYINRKGRFVWKRLIDISNPEKIKISSRSRGRNS